MSNYALILLLINIYNCGWSVSMHLKSNGNTETTDTLAGNLTLLANKCQNKLISSKIQDKSAGCSLLSLESTAYLKCLIFYDINKQMCNLSLDIKNEDYNTRLNEKLDVIEFCTDAKSWPVTDLDTDPHYSKMFKRIVSDSHLCTRFCESQDIFVDDVDFYCKYYKWGLDVLTQAKPLNAQMTQSEINPSISSDLVYNVPSSIIESPNVESDANNISHTLTLTTDEEQANNFIKEASELSPNQEAVSQPISETVNNINAKESQIFQAQFLNELPPDPDVVLAQQLGITSSEQLPLKQALANESDDNNFTETNIISTTTNKDLVLDNLPKVHPKLQVINNRVDVRDNGQVSEEESRNALLEFNMMEDIDFNGNLDFGTSKDIVKSIIYREPNLRGINIDEVYKNVMQESFTEDKDDHFFSLFLTGVVLVMLLYVLYHNKNKVSKVVIGFVRKHTSHHSLPTKMRY